MNTAAIAIQAPAAAGSTRGRPWRVAALLLAALVCLPIAAVVLQAFNPRENIWPHLLDTVLWHYVSTSLLLLGGVAIGTLVLGISAAWLVTHHDFPGRRLFTWALLLPFAVPAYVVAYVYTDLLEYAGPVQSFLRELFGWRLASEYWFPEIRNLFGAIVMLVLVLYPYVFMLARSAFLEQSASLVEAARLMGRSRRASFFSVAMPMARPAIVVGVTMALMETLNDYGTVDYFAVRSLSAGIYDVWLGMNNLGGGAQIATILLIFILMLVSLEKISRRHQANYQPGASRLRPLQRQRLSGGTALLASLWCLLPIVLGFVIPAIVLVRYSILYFAESWTADFQRIALNSLLLSGTAAIVTMTLGVVLVYAKRLRPSALMRGSIATACLGYAIPGPVIAIGVIIPFAAFDNTLDAFARSTFGISTGLLLSGTVFAILFAYSVRFLAVSFGAIDASMQKISPSIDDAARSLGRTPAEILRHVHLPLMRSGLLTAVLVVFVDCMKELPATLVLRPFNFDTLATSVYQLASDELIGQSALGAMLIVIAGLIPVILLSAAIDRQREVIPHVP